MATPLAKAKFQRAIGESGGNFQPMATLHEAEQTGVRFASGVGAHSLAELRAKPAGELAKGMPGPVIRPSVDGWMLPQDIYTIFATGKQNDVPLIAGSNTDEGTTLAPWRATGTAEAFTAQIRSRFGAMADRFLQLYPAATADQAREAHYASFAISRSAGRCARGCGCRQRRVSRMPIFITSATCRRGRAARLTARITPPRSRTCSTI
jgi:para-nitrobenzyl esterase